MPCQGVFLLLLLLLLLQMLFSITVLFYIYIIIENILDGHALFSVLRTLHIFILYAAYIVGKI